MSKVSTIKIPVSWESKEQTATAVFEMGCNAQYITKELNNAPVDLENEKTRHFAKNGWSVTDTASKAYFDSKIVLKIPSKSVDTDYIIDKSIWSLAKTNTVEASAEYPTVLEFSTELKTAAKDKQTV